MQGLLTYPVYGAIPPKNFQCLIVLVGSSFLKTVYLHTNAYNHKIIAEFWMVEKSLKRFAVLDHDCKTRLLS